APAHIGFENHVPSVWSAGVPFHFIPVADPAALAAAVPNGAEWTAVFGADSAYLYMRRTEGHDHAFRARMFAPADGIAEDPATGSAVAALAGAIADFDAPRDGEHAAIIEQGYEMARPSLIRLDMTIAGGALRNVRIGGHAVEIANGTLDV